MVEGECRRGAGREEERMNGVKYEVGYGGLRERLAPTEREKKGK